MAPANSPARAREQLDEQLRQIQWLRGTGPNPIDYDRWDERTLELLIAIYGEDSQEVRRYQEDVGKRGRLPGVRGLAEDMTLNIHGQWGILGRLERAETLLREYRDAINP
ncbi:MAG: hypothetical protein Kow0010_26340 [Dehalococcoidia bacterium]